MADLPKNIAIVYDRVNKWGGAEQVLLALHELFPQVPLYTAVYNPATASWVKVFPEIIPTFLQYFPFAKSRHELYPWLTPLAFESLNFDQFDAVISVTSADAKGIITKPHTFHFCYCLTPTRYLWSHEIFYKSKVSKLFHPVFNYLKVWDKIAANRPDSYIAISKTVQSRISSFYHRPSQVVYPPVDIERFSPGTKNDHFLSVGRLVSYKRPEIVVQLFNDLNLPLVMIGSGREEKKLRKLARPNIKILGHVSESELITYYQNSKALISVHEEDFGIVYAEAQAAGKPVLALNRGAVSEIVVQNETGYLASDIEDLKSAIADFSKFKFESQSSIANSQRFSRERFGREFVKVFNEAWTKYKHTLLS